MVEADGGDLRLSGTPLDEARAAWAHAYEGLSQVAINRRVLSFAALVRGIAEAGAVTPEEFGRQAGLAAAEARKLFERFAASGMEVDASGNIVGAALTTQRTAHSLSFGGRKFFAWCALDTLFIPGLLGEVADIESVCPVSNAAIRLVVTPEGVDTIDPADTVLSVVLPAAGCPERATGPASPT